MELERESMKQSCTKERLHGTVHIFTSHTIYRTLSYTPPFSPLTSTRQARTPQPHLHAEAEQSHICMHARCCLARSCSIPSSACATHCLGALLRWSGLGRSAYLGGRFCSVARCLNAVW